jgi:uncharacterized membrane protein
MVRLEAEEERVLQVAQEVTLVTERVVLVVPELHHPSLVHPSHTRVAVVVGLSVLVGISALVVLVVLVAVLRVAAMTTMQPMQHRARAAEAAEVAALLQADLAATAAPAS